MDTPTPKYKVGDEVVYKDDPCPAEGTILLVYLDFPPGEVGYIVGERYGPLVSIKESEVLRCR